MQIVDGICYAGTPNEEIYISDAKPLTGGMLLAEFSSGEKKLFDTTLLKEPAFLPLKDEEVFKNITVEHGFISWADGSIDIAPEYIYNHGIPYNENDVLKAG